MEGSETKSVFSVGIRMSLSRSNQTVSSRFLSNSYALAGMAMRASICNSEVESLVPSWGYMRDTKGCIDAILSRYSDEELLALSRAFLI